LPAALLPISITSTSPARGGASAAPEPARIAAETASVVALPGLCGHGVILRHCLGRTTSVRKFHVRTTGI
jgi:hypothetical protein